ncbi:MAG: exosome protein [Methanomicrobia archaeon]|nr:exosome protein [Methanomicrobia archaeon]
MIARIEIESFCHATEDEKKVLEALKNLTDAKFEKNNVVGHYGNPIKIYKVRITRKKDINDFLTLFNKIDKNILEPIEERIDEKGRFYLRLDKQSLYFGNFVIDNEGDVHIIIKIVSYPLRREKVIENAKKILGY